MAAPGSAIPHIPGFDTADAIERLAGDVELYWKVLEMVIPGLQASLAAFAVAANGGDRASMEAAAHSVRGMAANAGANALAETAAVIEAALRDGNADAEQIARFSALMKETLAQVEQALAGMAASTAE
jgi:HPt (histidine-containing phosphotransfer) domain-containing protein